MKKIYLFALSAMFGVSAMAQVSVTFQVDMNNQTVSPDGVHIAGDWQDEAGYAGDWDPTTSMMTDEDSDGIYSLNVDIPAGQYEYKFVNGSGWDFAEGVPAINQKGGGNSNRVFIVSDWHGNADNLPDGFVLPAVEFAGSAPMGEVAVRLVVDMSAQSEISDLGVHVAGTIINPEWTPGYGKMFNSENSKYAYVANVAADTEYLYKFLNGDDWGADEWNGGSAPDECTTDGNRTIAVVAEDIIMDGVCFEGCSTCAPLTEVTFKVNLSSVVPNSEGVSVAGSFQGWTPGATLMTDDDSDGVYEVSLMLEQGSYQYKFVNGITWDGGENVPGTCNVDGNRVVEVGVNAITEEYCFSQCAAECILDPEPSDITFRVNMMNETVAAEGVWVMGSFTTPQWQSGAVELTDADADGIYEATVEGVSGSADIQYKFANGDPTTIEENGDFLAGGCGVANGIGGFNRTLVRTDEDVVLDVVCYNSCADCVVGLEENQLGNVSIFPNPSTGVSYIDVQNPNRYTLRMNIVDITGKTVTESVVLNSTRNEINTANLNAGIYFLNIVNEHNDRAVYKLMVK